MSSYEPEVPKGKVVAWIVATVLIIAAVVAVAWTISYYTADVRGKVKQNEKIVGNANYRIAAYDHFYDLCGQVQTQDTVLTTANAALDAATKATPPDPIRISQLQANVTAAINVRADLINTYNQDARKTDTKGHFLSSDLPYTLDPNAEEHSCNAP